MQRTTVSGNFVTLGAMFVSEALGKFWGLKYGTTVFGNVEISYKSTAKILLENH